MSRLSGGKIGPDTFIERNAMGKARIFWTTEESSTVVKRAAELLVEKGVELKWDSARVFGLAEILEDAQRQLPQHRRRPNIGMKVGTYKSAVQMAYEKIKKPNPSPLAFVSFDSKNPPPIPSVLGLDPKVAEALAYIFQQGMRALGEQIGKTMGETLRDRHLYVPKQAQDAFEHAIAEALPEPNALPERLRKHKVMVSSLQPIQQQEIQRQFPDLEFRFLSGDTASKTVRDVAQKCERAYLMTRFIGHNIESGVKGLNNICRIPGGPSELARLIRMNYPQTAYRGHAHVS
jgi:hypothetical protein